MLLTDKDKIRIIFEFDTEAIIDLFNGRKNRQAEISKIAILSFFQDLFDIDLAKIEIVEQVQDLKYKV